MAVELAANSARTVSHRRKRDREAGRDLRLQPNQKSNLIICTCCFSNYYKFFCCASTERRQSLVASLQTFHRTQKAGFAHELVEQALLLDQLLRSVEFLDLALVEYDNAVAVKDCVDTMGDCALMSAKLVLRSQWYGTH
jgi:hypothetical protein